jgi:hypothetical protein
MLSLAYAFPGNDCDISYGKYIKINPQELDFVEIKVDKETKIEEIEDYIFP